MDRRTICNNTCGQILLKILMIINVVRFVNKNYKKMEQGSFEVEKSIEKKR